jgi:hypothetical protein
VKFSWQIVMCSPEKKKYNENFEMKSKCSIKAKQQLLNILKQKKDNIELKIQLRTGELIHFAMITRFDYVRI